MGIRTAWRALWRGEQRQEQKASAVGAMISFQNAGQARWMDRRYDKLAEEGYKRNVVAYRCIRIVAHGAANVPWLLYDAEGDDIEEHPLLDLLQRPNPLQAGAAMFETFYSFYLIAGNSYLEAVAAGGAPGELWPLRPDRMKVIPGPRGQPAAYAHQMNGQEHRFPVSVTGGSPVLHWKTFHPLDDWYGMSPIEAAAYSIDQHNAAGAWNQALLQNSARPSGALVYAPKEGPANLSDQQFVRLKDQIGEQYSGPTNAGRPMLLDGGLDWKEMSLSPKDMDFLNTKLQSARDICAAYGVPPMLVGVPGDATYANFKEARMALWEDTILPLLDSATDALNQWLVPAFGEGLRLDYDEDEISALGPRREELWARVQAAQFLTINEKRAALGYEEVDGGDDVLISATMVPLGMEPEDEEPPEVPDDATEASELAYGPKLVRLK